jgi:hypothetical protein
VALRLADPPFKESYQMSKNRLTNYQMSNYESENARGPNSNLLHFVILEWNLGKEGGKVWTACMCFRIGTSGGFL